ncbi:MAG: hypothetical protein ABMB14_12115 [Myxococcota bacterium]
MLTFGFATVAAAGVVVEDTVGCLDAEAVDLELRAELVEKADIRIGLGAAPAPALSLAVTDGDARVWDRVIAVKPEDCPYLPSLIALSLERGLSAIPGWGLPEPTRPPPEIGFVVSGSLPWAVRIAVAGDLWLPISGRIGLDLQPEVTYTAVERFGDQGGGAQLAAFGLAVGGGAQLPVGPTAIRLATRINPGVWVGVPRGPFDAQGPVVSPRVASVTELGWVASAAVRLGVRFEVPIVRLVLADARGAEDPEPPARIGLALTVAGRLGGRSTRSSDDGDVGRSDRP